MTTKEPAAPYAELMVLLAKYKPKRYFPKANNNAVINPPIQTSPQDISTSGSILYNTANRNVSRNIDKKLSVSATTINGIFT